jgi:predicted dehydrogenase
MTVELAPLRVGIVGCGWVSRQGHLPGLARLPEATVVAVADPDHAALERTGREFGVARRYPNHMELLADPAVEAVGVCVPAESHVQVGEACCQARKPFLLEKPPALDLGEWDRLSARIRSAGITFRLGLNMRWHGGYRLARQLVRDGAIGDLQAVRSALGTNSHIREGVSGWRTERRRGGGVLVETAVHHFDLWRFLAGVDVEEVFALTRGRDESLAVIARLAGGVPVSGIFSQRTTHVNEVELFGEAGRLRASPYSPPVLLRPERQPWTWRAKMAEVGAAMSPAHARAGRRVGGFFIGSFAAEWREFARAVRRGDPKKVEEELASARRLLQIVLATAAAAATDQTVRVDDAPPALT